MLPSQAAHPISHTLVLYDSSQEATECQAAQAALGSFSRQLLGCRELYPGQRLYQLGKYRHSRPQCPEQSLLLCSPFTFPTRSPHSLFMKYSSHIVCPACFITPPDSLKELHPSIPCGTNGLSTVVSCASPGTARDLD